MTDKKTYLTAQPLTADAFAPFGQVIETANNTFFSINNGSTKRYHQLAEVELGDSKSKAIINIFRADRLSYPLNIKIMERHPLGSQAFIPLKANPFLILVATPGEFKTKNLRLFISRGQQGINYGQGVWHHPILSLQDAEDFLVVDRQGPGNNCEEVYLDQSEQSFVISLDNID